MAFILIIFSENISRIILGSGNYYGLINLYAVLIFAHPLEELILDLVKIRKNALLFLKVQLIALVIFAVTVVLSFSVFNLGVLSPGLGQLASKLTIIILLIPYIKKHIAFRFDLSSLKPLLRYGYPLIIAVVALFGLQSADKYIVNSVLGLKEAGIYSFGAKFGELIIALFAIPAINILEPMIFSLQNNHEELRRFFRKSTIFVYLTGMAFCVVLSLFSEEVIYLMSFKKEFFTGWKIVPIVAFAYIHLVLVFIFIKSLELAEKTFSISMIYLVAFIVFVFSDTILAMEFGVYGAAIGLVPVFGLTAILSGYIADKYHGLKVKFLDIMPITILGIISIIPVYFLHAEMWLNLLYKFLLLIFFVLCSGLITMKKLEAMKSK